MELSEYRRLIGSEIHDPDRIIVPPSKRSGLTATQWLYREYQTAKRGHDTKRMGAAKRALVRICLRACGKLRPYWYDPVRAESDNVPYNPRFWYDAQHDRGRFAESFVAGEIERGMTLEEARHIGRRCKLRLIDDIRCVTGFRTQQRDEAFREALSTVTNLKANLANHKLWIQIKSCSTRREMSNVMIASKWRVSEGWVRKLRKRLAAHLWTQATNDGERQALAVLRLRP